MTAAAAYPTFITADSTSTVFHTSASGFDVLDGSASVDFDNPMKIKFDNEFTITGDQGNSAATVLTLKGANVEFDKLTCVEDATYIGKLATAGSPSTLKVTGKLTLLDTGGITLNDTTATIGSLTSPGDITLNANSKVTLSGLAEFTTAATTITVPAGASFTGSGSTARIFGNGFKVTLDGDTAANLKTIVAVAEAYTGTDYEIAANQSSLWDDTAKKWGLSK
jgi:hypothetical protein